MISFMTKKVCIFILMIKCGLPVHTDDNFLTSLFMYIHPIRRVPNVGSQNLTKTDDSERFVSDTRAVVTDADAIVHPLRPADGQCAPQWHCGAHCLGAVLNRHRAEK